MGICISYQGQLSDPGRVDEMVREVRAFAEHMGWKYLTVEELVAQGHIKDTGLRGISVQVHPQCDWMHFHVDDRGRLVQHGYHACLHDPEERKLFIEAMQHTRGVMVGFPKEELDKLEVPKGIDEFFEMGVAYNWSKTQFGGPEAHIQACNLLRFVRDRFAPELQVKDDTGYFEHGRIEELEGKMGQIDRMLHFARQAANRISQEGGVSDLNGLLEKLQRYMNEEQDKLH